ncbi:DUF4012 domain-containing protein [Nocardioides piscis]|uniref:DUF4012 domain-containing protein n=1 Tax=Nocardioides piscis TaxID=2714938 RepID=A0A6G7YF79_9ACTN|nr:DUF4012 domain-containing protein [Nocardioides piscis]QIK75267.1 DUF4012 domain-containing protein [Nocardioides piscis]
MPGPGSRLRTRLVVLLLAVVCLFALMIAGPLVWTWWQGNQTQAALEDATRALEDQDLHEADDHVADARAHADRAVATRHGLLGAMWRNLPVLRQAQPDAVRMTDSVDDLTTIAEEGLRVYPLLTGDEGDLVTDGRVDLATLDRVVVSFEDIESRVQAAHSSLTAVEGDAPLIGGQIREMRDEGLDGLAPLARGLERVAPLVDALPAMLGAESRQDYLIAILNPAEQLFSGGTPLTFTPMSVVDGRIEMGTPQDTATHGEAFQPRYWKKVKGNPFHRGRLRIGTATFAPDWSVSGEEALRAWGSLGRRKMDGLIAIDVMALRDLVALTGPLDVPFYGEITADNFVQTLIGSYDNLTDYRGRHQINQALVPIFRDRLFATGKFVEKLQALQAAAEGRHFAVYLRDPARQRAFSDLGLTGELSDTRHDYLGVFTQNAVPSKTDYWQNRTVTSDVRLDVDGSARVRVATRIHNDSTPYPFKGPDPRSGYSTRYASLSVAQFLPRGATDVVARVDGQVVDLPVADFYGRPYVRRTIDFKPQAEHTFALSYDVPRAAEVTDGGLAYRLDVDPQGLVRPSAIAVTVQLPPGFVADDLPEHWFEVGEGTIGWGGPALVDSPSFEVTASLRG